MAKAHLFHSRSDLKMIALCGYDAFTEENRVRMMAGDGEGTCAHCRRYLTPNAQDLVGVITIETVCPKCASNPGYRDFNEAEPCFYCGGRARVDAMLNAREIGVFLSKRKPSDKTYKTLAPVNAPTVAQEPDKNRFNMILTDWVERPAEEVEEVEALVEVSAPVSTHINTALEALRARKVMIDKMAVRAREYAEGVEALQRNTERAIIDLEGILAVELAQVPKKDQ